MSSLEASVSLMGYLKNLMRTDTVGLKDGGKSVVVIVESHLVPVLGLMNSAESVMGTRGAGTAAREVRRIISARWASVATARAAVGACQSVAVAGERKSTRVATTREPDDRVLHLVKCERVAFVNVGEKLFICLLVAGGFREVEALESDEDVDIRYRHGLDVA
jgi:hypothetical protein